MAEKNDTIAKQGKKKTMKINLSNQSSNDELLDIS